MKDQIINAYETMAKHYDAMIDVKPHNAFYDRPNTLALITEPKGKKILDAGCGPGKYAEILMADGAEVTGFDISPQMVELAKKRNPEKGTFFVHDFADPLTTLADASFDVIVCALALHYIEDWTGTIQEFCRLLKPKGQLVISTEHPFFDYTYYKSEHYFKTEAVKATWTGFGIPVEVHSYRRPLMSSIAPLVANGFYIDALIEPKPTPEFEKHDPKHFAELNAFPAFMCIRAVKK